MSRPRDYYWASNQNGEQDKVVLTAVKDYLEEKPSPRVSNPNPREERERALTSSDSSQEEKQRRKDRFYDAFFKLAE